MSVEPIFIIDTTTENNANTKQRLLDKLLGIADDTILHPEKRLEDIKEIFNAAAPTGYTVGVLDDTP